MYVQAETSAGAFQRGEAICKAAHQVGALVIADCVTSLGAMPVEVDKTGIDVAYSCSQKGLSCPPGLAPITVSPRAAEWLKTRTTPNRSWYFDLKLIADYLVVSRIAIITPHRRPCSTRLHEGLTLIEEEGLRESLGAPSPGASGVRANHRSSGTGDAGVADGQRIWNLNTPKVPQGVDDAKVRATLLQRQRHRDRRRLRPPGRQRSSASA